MNWIESMLVTLGLSLDVFAVVECQGALAAKIEKKHLSMICALVAAWQTGALCVGNLAAVAISKSHSSDAELFLGHVVAAAIFVCLGVRMICKAAKNERIVERRENNLGIVRFIRLEALVSVYTLLAGLAFGFIASDLRAAVTMIVCFTIAVVIIGMYTGYHFGYELKTKIYIAGGILLLAGGVVVIGRCILF